MPKAHKSLNLKANIYFNLKITVYNYNNNLVTIV